ncbi:MAG: hypothetical protein QOG53_1886 [Frankiales bacterium]|jgi:GT2 family glycosyltransferase|nr:hypothetical protein [Frankiales bacterium]
MAGAVNHVQSVSELPTRTAAVVLNWKNAPDTIRCLDALTHHTDNIEAVDVIVVDNGSGDGSSDRIRAAHPEATILQLEANTGFARGINAGLHWVLDRHEHDVIVFLNNDAILTPANLDRATNIVRKDPTIGMVTGKVLRHDGPIWYGGGRLLRLVGGVRINGQGQLDSGQCDRASDVTFLSLAFAVARREVVERVGLLSEDYFFGQEEWDYSLRVRRAGLRLRYEPSVVCLHGGDGSHKNTAPEFIYNGYRNKLIFQKTHLPRPVYWLWWLAFATYTKTIMPRRVRRLPGQPVEPEVLKFCAKTALADHAASSRPIEEADLLGFQRRLEEALASAEKSRP